MAARASRSQTVNLQSRFGEFFNNAHCMQIIMYYISGVFAYNHNAQLVTKEPHPIYLGLFQDVNHLACSFPDIKVVKCNANLTIGQTNLSGILQHK